MEVQQYASELFKANEDLINKTGNIEERYNGKAKAEIHDLKSDLIRNKERAERVVRTIIEVMKQKLEEQKKESEEKIIIFEKDAADDKTRISRQGEKILEQDGLIKDLKDNVEKLETKVNTLENRLSTVERALESLQIR